MSANIPYDIQEEIIKRVLPVKSLIRFRSVSKQWKSLIDSSEFVTHHTLLNHPQPRHLLVRYTVDHYKETYVSIADDDSFPHHKFNPILPPTVKLLRFVSMLDSSHGLMCLHGFTQDEVNGQKLIVVWNPLIRKFVGIPIPDGGGDVIGFGVCPKTSDPKIVKINDAKAEVFTLSSGAWRSVSMNLPYRSLHFWTTQVVVDGVIHWLVYDSVTNTCRIISFDLATEEFGVVVDLPNYLVEHSRRLYSISKINESLVVLTSRYLVDNDPREPLWDVWMMLKNGVSKPSFTKIFSVNDIRVDSVIGFSKNGQPIIMDQMHRPDCELGFYEPCSERTNSLGIYGSAFMMTSYTESLLLLNHGESIFQS